MAGDWMKIELELPDKPEVHAISSQLNIDPDAVVGKLIRVWQWFDKHTTDGNAYGVTYSLPDRITGVIGFGEAMMFVGWLEQADKNLVMPKFDRHTSASAKQRALTAKRVAKTRNGNSNAPNVTQALAREEKRRVKENTKRNIPEDFGISERVVNWAIEKGYYELDAHLANFISSCKKHGYKYVDWDEAFMEAIRKNWAGVKPELAARKVSI
jgi:hypothetical protein